MFSHPLKTDHSLYVRLNRLEAMCAPELHRKTDNIATAKISRTINQHSFIQIIRKQNHIVE